MIDLPPPEPPAYVIVIQADDLGYDDLAVNGNPIIETPNLDRLARNSVTATHFVVNPVCSASRASFLTGRHFLRTGVSHVHGGKEFLHRDEVTLGDAFQQGGWKTATWGKWHSGTTDGYLPWDRGFDEAFVADLYRHENARGLFNGQRIETDQWADALLVDYVIQFLEKQRGEPGFLYLSTMTPHTPLHCPEPYREPYLNQGLSDRLATLYGMITYLDEELGRLFNFLETEGLAEDTLILFFSDNGPAINNGLLTDEDRHVRKTSSRRGWKGDIWENGVISPLFIHWPAKLAPRVIRTRLDQVDLYPTLLDLCGIDFPEGQLELDGESFASALLNGEEPEARPIFNYAHPGWITSRRPYTPVGIRGEYNPVSQEAKLGLKATEQPISVTFGRYKLLFNPFIPEQNPESDDRFMLVDLFRDPGETKDIKSESPEVFTELRGKLSSWYAGIQAAEHSYTSPYLVIDGDTEIAADNVSRVSPTNQNTVHFVQGWNAVGQFAEYQIEVKTPGVYTVKLDWLVAPEPGFHFQIQSSGSSATGVSGEGSETSLGALRLETESNHLTLSLKDLPGGVERASQLAAIHLSLE